MYRHSFVKVKFEMKLLVKTYTFVVVVLFCLTIWDILKGVSVHLEQYYQLIFKHFIAKSFYYIFSFESEQLISEI